MKKLVLLVGLFGMSMACAPKKHGPVDKVPTKSTLAKVAAVNPFGHKPSKENAKLVGAVKEAKFTRSFDSNTKTYSVSVTFTFNKEAGVLPKDHAGVVVVSGSSKGKSSAQAKTQNDGNGGIVSHLTCDNHCKSVAVWLKVTGPEAQAVTRIGGWGFDGLKKKQIWVSDEVAKKKK